MTSRLTFPSPVSFIYVLTLPTYFSSDYTTTETVVAQIWDAKPLYDLGCQ